MPNIFHTYNDLRTIIFKFIAADVYALRKILICLQIFPLPSEDISLKLSLLIWPGQSLLQSFMFLYVVRIYLHDIVLFKLTLYS